MENIYRKQLRQEHTTDVKHSITEYMHSITCIRECVLCNKIYSQKYFFTLALHISIDITAVRFVWSVLLGKIVIINLKVSYI